MKKQWVSGLSSQLRENPLRAPGQIRAQNPSTQVKSRISSAHIFSWSFPSGLTWNFSITFCFLFLLFFRLQYHIFLFHEHIPLYNTLLQLQLWNLCNRRVSILKIWWIDFLSPRIRVFSNESTLLIRWPKYWSFSFSISPSREHPGLISFRMDWLDLLKVQGTLKSLLQHHNSKASVFWCSAFFIVQLSHSYMTADK